MNKGDFIT